MPICLQVLIPAGRAPPSPGSWAHAWIRVSNKLSTPKRAAKGLSALWKQQTKPLQPFPSIPEAGEIPGWLSGGVSTFIDFCLRRGRDLIGMRRFLTPVSASQQG